MEHDPRAWLWDVREAADRIAAFVRDRNIADYLADLLLRSAVERQFEIIGEALNSLSKETPDLPPAFRCFGAPSPCATR